MKEFNCHLESINPALLVNKSKNDDLDNFFLILGVIFNDLKGLILFNDLVKNTYEKPIPNKISAHLGEYNGVQIQIFKLSVSLINEFLIILEKNKNIINDIKFKLIEKKLNKDLKDKWVKILSIALGESKNSSSYLSKIAQVRSNITYHYDQSGTQLRKFFIDKFFNQIKDQSNREAFYSIGNTIENTRFFYCDAIIHEYINKNLKVESLDYMKKTNDIIMDMEGVIAHLLKNFYLYKKGVLK